MSPRMKRLQIYLESELDKELASLAIHRGVSKAQLIREGTRRLIREEIPPEKDPILSIVALGRSHEANISESHDKYLSQQKLKRSR